MHMNKSIKQVLAHILARVRSKLLSNRYSQVNILTVLYCFLDHLYNGNYTLVGEMSGRGNSQLGKCSVGGNVRSGNCPVGEMSGRGNVQSGNCPRGTVRRGTVRRELSVGELSSRGSVWIPF